MNPRISIRPFLSKHPYKLGFCLLFFLFSAVSFASPGCTDPLACNYDYTSLSDDGSCCYGNCVTFLMFDSYSYSWDGALYEIYDANTDLLIASGDLDNASTPYCDDAAFDNICLSEGCYYLNVGGGSFDDEISWVFSSGVNGAIQGDAPVDHVYFSVGNISCYSCHEEVACNYNPITVLHDCDLCEYETCQGCTYPFAPEYDSTATIDNGLCSAISAPSCDTDLNDDGVVNISDLLELLTLIGSVCP